MAKGVKRKQAALSQPITAFFERKRPAVECRDEAGESAQRDASDARESVEEIDADADDDRGAADAAAAREPVVLNTAHLTRMLQRRELGASAVMLARSVPCSSARRRRQQTDQRLARWALTKFRVLPLQLELPEDAMRVVGSHRLVSHCDEFYASCMAFDSQGALLVAGSSNGVIALFDCDELFHRTVNLQQIRSEGEASPPTPAVHPIHMIHTGMEVQCVRWNPSNEDEIGCCFLNRNEIYLYNLQKFPSKPDLVLKATSRPSSGYTDFIFLPVTIPEQRPILTSKQKRGPKMRNGMIIAGDIDGGLRSWDLQFPTKPQWSISTGSQAVTAVVLSHDGSTLLCATEGGILMTYDVKKLVVPAFGSKPMPQRKSLIRLVEAILPHLTSETATILKNAMMETATVLAISSMQLVPTSSTQVLLQLRNQWLVVLDTITGAIIKLHTPVKELPPPVRTLGQALPATVLQTTGNELDPQHRVAAARQRHSWLHQHRCSMGLAFDGEMACTGVTDENWLSFVDLNRVDLIRSRRVKSHDVSVSAVRHDYAERLSRFCIDIPERATAVAAHPTRHWILCGGADLRIYILYPWDALESCPTHETNTTVDEA